ncbi:hypothetical protein GCM10022251_39260 [Phytohabitans flavus]|uniref:Uncharacterized protein n=1 Tax=Phytohabitans flavus TaxID=1076124 RepID=A0A6F8XVI2_9ACTN|nr:hypothetical protein Pflav_041580 [Phytohabitans flavus]
MVLTVTVAPQAGAAMAGAGATQTTPAVATTAATRSRVFMAHRVEELQKDYMRGS